MCNVYWIILSLVLTVGSIFQDCILPEHPANGKHMPFESDCPAQISHTPSCQSVPGTRVMDGWFLFVKCDEGFVLEYDEHGYSQSTCADGKWLPALPSCVYNFTNDRHKCTAPSYPAHGKYKPLPIECALNNKASEGHLLPRTFVPSSCILLYSCNDGFELSDDDVISICDKGDWNPKFITCKAKKQGSSIIATKTLSSGCILPQRPQNMKYCLSACKECYYNNMCWYAPGSVVTDNVIQVQCDPGYRLAGNSDVSYNRCENGSWSSEFPQCLKLCPPLESYSVYPKCTIGNLQVDCSKPMLPNTTATCRCKESHREYPSLARAGRYKRVLICKPGGKWSYDLPECEPVCGISKQVVITPTIIDGEDTPLGAFPWHAGLYKRVDSESWTCICGGSLITSRLVLTAAHCVVLQNPNDIRVALGKYYQSWSIDEPFDVKRNVSTIRIPPEYRGASSSYVWDIALLLLSETVEFNSYVMPVCEDVQHTLQVTRNTTGYVVGWGKTKQNEKGSETLLHNNLTVLDYSVCFREIPNILSFDKFCGAKGSASVAEKGDSGGGLTMISNDQHFIIGIVSVKIKNLSVFTNVSWASHKAWINDIKLSLETQN